MARRNRTSYEAYPEDIFDNPPQGPSGIHRGGRSALSRTVPFIVVIVVAALVGVLVWSIYSGTLRQMKFPWQSAASSSAVTTSAKSSASGSAATSSSATPSSATPSSPSSSASTSSPSTAAPAQGVDKSLAIRVLNATTKSGYAAQKAAVLRTAGYTNVVAASPKGTLPASTVVWYQSNAQKATAQDVATALGISAVQQQTGIAEPIVVILLS